MREQLGLWGLSALAHGAFLVVAMLWPVAPEPDGLVRGDAAWERLVVPVRYIAPPEPKPEIVVAAQAASVDAGGEADAAPALRRAVAKPKPEPKPDPEPVKAPKAREAAPVVVERVEEAAAPVAAPVEQAAPSAAEATTMASAVVQGPAPTLDGAAQGRGVGGGGQPGERVGIGGGVDRAGLLKAYRRSIYMAVDARKQYPVLARRARLSGVVHVAVVVDGAGKILEVGVERSSGHEVLDEAACDAVRGIDRLPSPPEGLEWERQKIVIPVKYVS